MNKSRKSFSPSPIGFVLIISNLKRFAIAGECAKSYIRRADVTGGWVGEEERLRRLGYNGWYNSREVNKFREVKDILGTSCNKEMTRKKSIKKEAKCRED